MKASPARARISIAPPPMAMPVKGPARLMAIRFPDPSARASPALQDVSPPNPMRSIFGVSPKDRPTSACPSSCIRTPTNTIATHCARLSSPPPKPRSATTTKNEPWTRTGIEPMRNARFIRRARERSGARGATRQITSRRASEPELDSRCILNAPFPSEVRRVRWPNRVAARHRRGILQRDLEPAAVHRERQWRRGGSGSGGTGGSGGSLQRRRRRDDAGFGAYLGGGPTCATAATLVYVLSQENDLYSFNPPSKTFTKIGTLDCVAPGLAPNSMAVSRDAVAWVNYAAPDDSSGAIFQVSTTDASCQPTQASLQPGWTRIGMGFSTDSDAGTSETLFVAATGSGERRRGHRPASRGSGSPGSTSPRRRSPPSAPSVARWPGTTPSSPAAATGASSASSRPRRCRSRRSTRAPVRQRTSSP